MRCDQLRAHGDAAKVFLVEATDKARRDGVLQVLFAACRRKVRIIVRLLQFADLRPVRPIECRGPLSEACFEGRRSCGPWSSLHSACSGGSCGSTWRLPTSHGWNPLPRDIGADVERRLSKKIQFGRPSFLVSRGFPSHALSNFPRDLVQTRHRPSTGPHL